MILVLYIRNTVVTYVSVLSSCEYIIMSSGHQVLNITPGLDIDAAAAEMIKAASATINSADMAARIADKGHGLPELATITGTQNFSSSSSSVDSSYSDEDVASDSPAESGPRLLDPRLGAMFAGKEGYQDPGSIFDELVGDWQPEPAFNGSLLKSGRHPFDASSLKSGRHLYTREETKAREEKDEAEWHAMYGPGASRNGGAVDAAMNTEAGYGGGGGGGGGSGGGGGGGGHVYGWRRSEPKNKTASASSSVVSPNHTATAASSSTASSSTAAASASSSVVCPNQSS